MDFVENHAAAVFTADGWLKLSLEVCNWTVAGVTCARHAMCAHAACELGRRSTCFDSFAALSCHAMCIPYTSVFDAAVITVSSSQNVQLVLRSPHLQCNERTVFLAALRWAKVGALPASCLYLLSLSAVRSRPHARTHCSASVAGCGGVRCGSAGWRRCMGMSACCLWQTRAR